MYEIDTRLDNLTGSVLSEGRYIEINEKTFEFLSNIGVGGSGKRVQLLQMVKRAFPQDPHFIFSENKSVIYAPPFNLRIPDVPEGCTPAWYTLFTK